MGTSLEIERKFLVKSDSYKRDAYKSIELVQGYLSSVPERSVRVRTAGDRGYLTIKGIGNKSGLSRYEWEKEIPLAEAKDLLKICEEGIIDKTRFLVKEGIHTFEVDEFRGNNKGLVVAEVELESEDESFLKPDWLGEEVTGDDKYYNSALSNHPFSEW